MKHSKQRKLMSIGVGVVLLTLTVLPFGAAAQPLQPQPAPRLERVERMHGLVGLMQNFFSLIDSIHGIASSPEKAVILQLHEIEEIYKKRGEWAKVIPVFRRVLKETDNRTIRNVAYLKLAEVLRQTGHGDEAIATLEKALGENIKKIK